MKSEEDRPVGKIGYEKPTTVDLGPAAPVVGASCMPGGFFAGSPEPPEPPGDVTISGTFSSNISAPYTFLRFGTPGGGDSSIWCGAVGSTFNVALPGLDPKQNWRIRVAL